MTPETGGKFDRCDAPGGRPSEPYFFGVAFAVAFMLVAMAQAPGRGGGVQGPIAQSGVSAVSDERVTVPVSLLVSSPSHPVARFSLTPLPAIASVVVVRRMHELALARLGGRSGP